MFENIYLQTIWFILTALVTALMFAAQIGPKAAISNLAQWIEWAHFTPPVWLRSPRTDRIVKRIGWVLLAVLMVVGLWLFQSQQVALGAACGELVVFSFLALRSRTRPVALALTIVSFVTLGVGITLLILEGRSTELIQPAGGNANAPPSTVTPQTVPALPQVGSNASGSPLPPDKPERKYDPSEIEDIRTALKKLRAHVDQTFSPARQGVADVMGSWEHRIKINGPSAVAGLLVAQRDKLRGGAKELNEILFNYREHDDRLRTVVFGDDRQSAPDAMDSALSMLIDDLQELSKTPGVNVVKWTAGRVEELGRVRAAFDQWIGAIDGRIGKSIEELRNLKRADSVNPYTYSPPYPGHV